MKLCYSPTSPYVRKVNVCAIELGLDHQMERVGINPWAPEPELLQKNPLGRIPVLVTDDGVCLYDSVVICEYLDSLSDRHTLFPQGADRWSVLRQHALSNGVIDASVNALVERVRRPENLMWQDWIDFQLDAVRCGLVAMEQDSKAFDGERLTVAQITAGVALGYLDFRFAADVDWRSEHPHLAQWYETFAERNSMLATVPKAPQ